MSEKWTHYAYAYRDRPLRWHSFNEDPEQWPRPMGRVRLALAYLGQALRVLWHG